MFSFFIGGNAAIFSKFFSAADSEAVLTAVPEGARRVIFVDTPATVDLVATVEVILGRGVEVFVRDHHDPTVPGNPREQQIAAAAARVRELIGGNAVISNRQANPACSGLLTAGEFADPGTVIVADPDPDGLLGAMKAAGVAYPGMDQDADVLDSGRAGQTADRLTASAWLLVRAMATLPPYDPGRPQVSEEAKAKLFSDFVAAVQGDGEARTRMEKGVEVYEAGVAEARRLAGTVIEPFPGLAVVDATASARFDLATLAAAMESRPGVRVTAQRKSLGPIAVAEKAAGRPAVQYSLAVAKAHQAEVNLQELLPAGFVSSPETGVISNTSFLLHVSEAVWTEVILPALRARLGQ